MFALIGYGLLGLVVAVGVVSLLVIVLPADHLAAAPRDVVPSGLPARPEIRGEDVARVRLPVTLRGYRMVDTDAILDRLAFELERRDQEIDNLRQRAGLPPRAAIEDSAPDSPSDPSDDRARDEVLLTVGAASGEAGVSPGSLSPAAPTTALRHDTVDTTRNDLAGGSTGAAGNSTAAAESTGAGSSTRVGNATDALSASDAGSSTGVRSVSTEPPDDVASAGNGSTGLAGGSTNGGPR